MAVLGTSGRRQFISVGARAALAIALLFGLGFSARARAAEGSGFNESQVKAAFVYHLTQFVEWPPGSFSSAADPIIIGVVGEDPFEGNLDQIIRGEKVNGRALEIRRFPKWDEVQTCHVLFICKSEAGRTARIVEGLRATGTLTVGDTDEFDRSGGMVRMVAGSGKIRLRINLDAAREAKLALSAKLLRLAEVVTSGPK